MPEARRLFGPLELVGLIHDDCINARWRIISVDEKKQLVVLRPWECEYPIISLLVESELAPVFSKAVDAVGSFACQRLFGSIPGKDLWVIKGGPDSGMGFVWPSYYNPLGDEDLNGGCEIAVTPLSPEQQQRMEALTVALANGTFPPSSSPTTTPPVVRGLPDCLPGVVNWGWAPFGFVKVGARGETRGGWSGGRGSDQKHWRWR